METKNLDISVLMLFFNRADHFGRVWQEVKKARPARLFLYQDGPRLVNAQGQAVATPEESKDWEGICACRTLVADDQIDWPCEVHRNYLLQNQGCDPSGYRSQQWAFSLTDKCIVLEDDVVPSQSFFPFCKEMLDRYEDDERVTLISGFMTSSQRSEKESYFFSRVFSIWGWASWARVINNRDGHYGFVKDERQFALLKEKVRRYGQRADMTRMCVDHAASGKEYFESIFWSYMLLHDGLAIFPSRNLINNIGMDGGTHFSAQLDLLPKRMRWQFVMPRHELTFPLVHPQQVVEDDTYQREHYLMNAWNHPWRKMQYSIEELWLNLRAGKMKKIGRAMKNRVLKTIGKKKHV